MRIGIKRFVIYLWKNVVKVIFRILLKQEGKLINFSLQPKLLKCLHRLLEDIVFYTKIQ